MNLLERANIGEIKKTERIHKISIDANNNKNYPVYQIPLEYLYYNNQNGRINTAYRKYLSNHDVLTPELGNSDYNDIFEDFIYKSSKKDMDNTIKSMRRRGQDVPGVVLPDGRVIDGNRRLTALRKIQKESNKTMYFEAVILELDVNSKYDQKKIKGLELYLQHGMEGRVNYDPIDRIFDVYNTIVVEQLMTVEEYREAYGERISKQSIDKSIGVANLIIRFVNMISPGGNAIDKFYLAKDLKLDGPLEEVYSVLKKIDEDTKDEIIDSTLAYLLITKNNNNDNEPTKAMRKLKKYILNNKEVSNRFVNIVDKHVDDIYDSFTSNPVENSNELKLRFTTDNNFIDSTNKIKKSTEEIIKKEEKNKERLKAIFSFYEAIELLEDLSEEDFDYLDDKELIELKGLASKLSDELYRIKRII